MALNPAPPRVSDRYPQEVASQSRRITGVTPAVTKSFSEKPWRYLPKAKGLQVMAGRGAGRKGSLV